MFRYRIWLLLWELSSFVCPVKIEASDPPELSSFNSRSEKVADAYTIKIYINFSDKIVGDTI